MPFKKGHIKHPASGMKTGHKSAKVQAWEVLGDYLCNDMADQYLAWIKTLKGEEMAKQFQTMIEFFKPKLQRADITSDARLSIEQDHREILKRMFADSEEVPTS